MTMIELWGDLSPDQLDKICAMLRRKNKNISRGLLALMEVDNVLEELMKSQRGNIDSSYGVIQAPHSGAAIDEIVTDSLFHVWYNLYYTAKRHAKANND